MDEVGEDESPTYYDRDGNEVPDVHHVVVPCPDPVPHYNRGRTRVQARMAGAMRDAQAREGYVDPAANERLTESAMRVVRPVLDQRDRAWAELGFVPTRWRPGDRVHVAGAAGQVVPPAERVRVRLDDGEVIEVPVAFVKAADSAAPEQAQDGAR